MKLKILAVIASMLICNQAFAYASAAAAGAAAAAAGAAASSSMMDRHPSFQINASGKLDMTGRDVCDISHMAEYGRLKNCKPGDVVVMAFGEDETVFNRLFQTCDTQEPIYALRWRIACVYKPNDIKIYRPKPVRKAKPAKEFKYEEPKRAPEKRPSDHVE